MAAVVRAAVLKNYIEIANSLGINGTAMLREAGIAPSSLADTECMIPFAAVLHLLEDSAREGRCESFGLLMAESRQLSDFGVVSLLISHQRTLRDALLTTIEYRHLINRTLAMNLEESGKTVIIREEVMAGPDLPKRQGTELALAILFRMCGSLMGNLWNPRSVSFDHAAPADRQVHQRLFRCRVDFDAEYSGIVCHRADLDAPNPKADPAMAAYARRFMESMDKVGEDSLLFDVRKAIYLLMPVGRATVEQTAHGLGVSVRTLQRELDQLGVSFSQLLNSVRRELAMRYLENRNYSLQRVGLMLGYAVPSSFTRWFASEFGASPRLWRTQQKQ